MFRDRRAVDPIVLLPILILIAFTAATGNAQVEVSSRIRGMGADFAGIVDDPITDATLNPARLSAFRGFQAYVGRPGERYPRLLFPDFQSSNILAPEDYATYDVTLDDFSYVPSDTRALTMTLFAPAMRGMRSAFTLDVVVDGDERSAQVSTLSESREYPNGVRSSENAGASQTDQQRYVFSAAVSTSDDPEANAIGVRLRAFYERYDDHSFDSFTILETSFETAPQQEYESRTYRSDENYEDLGAELALGWFRPAGWLREASLAVTGRRVSDEPLSREVYLFDEDYDGDGVDENGFTPVNYFEMTSRAPQRELTGGEVALRAVSAHGQRVRGVYRVGAERLTGDGDGVFETDEVEQELGVDERSRFNITHEYDTEVTRLYADATLGFVEEFDGDWRFAAAALVGYARDEYDETASGTGAVMLRDRSDVVEASAPYDQSITLEADILSSRLSAGAEWDVNRFISFRMGVLYEAYRRKTSSSSTRSVDIGEPFRSLLVDVGSGRRNTDYYTVTSMHGGLSVRLGDRLFVDLHNNSWSFAGYSYGSVRYVF